MPDAALPNEECRMFLLERLAEETENALKLSTEQVALRTMIPEVLANTGLPAALGTALAWARSRDARRAEEFQKQTIRALYNAQDALNKAKD